VALQSLAVQPLGNASGDSEKEYLADGLTEYLHSALTGVAALRVASRGATAALFGHASLADQGRLLDVQAIGRRQDNALRPFLREQFGERTVQRYARLGCRRCCLFRYVDNRC